MTTPHPIGELLTTGVRPTDEETEHLTALGGFVAEMYGRYLEGHSLDVLQSSSDAWSKKLSGRLAASTAERWQAGLGLADMLLDNGGFSSWWQISKDGFANGYGDFDAEREILALFEEEPQVVAEAEEAPAPRRRRSLFGEKSAQPGAKRRALKRAVAQPGAVARMAERAAGAPAEAKQARAARWADGSVAELTVLKALAAGGLNVADQVAEVLEGAPAEAGTTAGIAADAPMRWQPRQSRPMAAAAGAALRQIGQASVPGQAQTSRRSIALDGMRVDERTPALATALERARAVFGANVTGPSPALNASRLEALTSAVKVSIDRGLGEGERPVYGFYDAVESTFLSLAKEGTPEAPPAAEAEAAQARPGTRSFRGARAPRARAAQAQPQAAQKLAPARFEQRNADARRAAPMQHVSLDRVVPTTAGEASARSVRPFTAGVFAAPGQAPAAMDIASRVSFTPTAQPVASVQRGAVSAPRMSVATFAPQAAAAQARAFDAAMPSAAPFTAPQAQAAQMASAMGSVAQPTWRLAADRGADLPIGASFGRAEVFGATRDIGARAEVRSAEAFRPVIARSSEDAVARPNRLADAVDGLVWVSTPNTAIDVGAPLTQVGDVPMAAVPSGRSAAMVPAGAAFTAIARAAAGQTRTSAPAAEVGAMPTLAQTAPARFSAANVVELLRSGVLARMAPQAELGGFTAEAAGALPRVAATESLAAGVGSTPVADATVARPGIASTQPLAAASVAGVQPRWLDAVLADSTTAPALRATRWLEDVIAQGGYGRIDDGRVMLAIANAAAPQAEAAPEAEATTTTARAFNRLARLQARQTAARPAVAQARTQGQQAPARAARATTEVAAGAPGVSAPGFAGGAAASFSPTHPLVQRAAEARQALLRPVMTARESRAAAGVLGAQGVTSFAGQPAASGYAPTALKLAVEAARAQGGSVARAQVPGAVGANEPVLSRIVSAAYSERGAAQPISARWDADGGLVERVARLGSSERRQVVQMLSSAGWTAGELELLDLAGPTAPVGEAQARVEGGAVRGVRQARTATARGEARNVEAAPVAARVGRMGQSIARVMSGAEALGGNVAETVSGSQAQAVARAQASAWLPLLGNGSADKYFGGLAPSTTARPQMALASVGDAMGELVKMAEVAAAQSDTVVATEAQRETLRRVLATRGSIAEAVRAVQAQTPRGAAAAATRAQALGVAAGTEATRVAAGTTANVAGGAGATITNMANIERTLMRSLATAVGGDRATIREAAMGAGIDQALVERAMQRAGVDVPAAAAAERFGAAATERALDLPEAERTMVGLAVDAPAATTEAQALGTADATKRGAGLEQRLARALALSTAGPAGARRLTRALLGTKAAQTEERAPARTRREAQARAAEGSAAAEPVRRTALTGATFRNVGLEAAAVGEETQHALPIGLGQAIAPEVMLAGLRSPELARAVKSITQRQSLGGWDSVGVFTTLSDAGIDLGAARTSIAEDRGQATRSLFAREEIGALIQNRGVDAPTGTDVAAQLAELGHMSPRVAAMMRDASRAGGSTQQALLEVLAGGDARSAIARAGLSKKQRAGLLSAVLRGTERAERSSLLEAAGGSDFAYAWLARVDGTKSGLDIGLGETKNELGRTFGKRRDSALAESSPMGGASLVSTAAASAGAGEGGGLRSVGAGAAGPSSARAAGGGASDAMRRTDWRFVETGSRASTAHADLGKLAAAIVGNSESGKRAPMPLVAPVAKAVAQTALRKPASESSAKGGGGGGGGGGGKKGPDPKLSEKAIEALAVEMANRVARLMGLMKERIGVW